MEPIKSAAQSFTVRLNKLQWVKRQRSWWWGDQIHSFLTGKHHFNSWNCPLSLTHKLNLPQHRRLIYSLLDVGIASCNTQFHFRLQEQNAAHYSSVSVWIFFSVIFGMCTVSWIVAVKVKVAVGLQGTQKENDYTMLQDKKIKVSPWGRKTCWCLKVTKMFYWGKENSSFLFHWHISNFPTTSNASISPNDKYHFIVLLWVSY